ncbi:MAG: TonB-dependent receptor [Woeseiaceae bacterium]|nr:TonB-dependent receptor [Woeseiaceae bacterium]
MTNKNGKDATSGEQPISNDSPAFRVSALAAAIVTALGPAQAALAQEDDSSIEEILVTATKREMNLQDIPHSIDVLSGVELQLMRARDLQATLRALPSVGLVSLQPGQNSLIMRGITTEPFEYRTDAQVAVYLDEQPMSSNSQQVGFRGIDIARVENLPGPQGTLFGASSQTGTIRYITNKPDFSGFGGQVETAYATTSGAEDSWDINAVLNIPIVDEKLGARLVAYSSHDGGYVDNVFGTSFTGNYDNADRVEDDFNEYDVTGGRLHLLWNISDEWSLLASLIAENTEAVGVWDSDSALGDYEVTRFQDEFRDDDWTSMSMTLEGDLGFADLSMTYTRFDRDIVYEYDNMTYTQSRDYYYGNSCNTYGYSCLYYSNFYESYIFNDQEQERDAFEARLVSKGDQRLQWMVGAYYEDFLNEWFYGAKIPGLENTTMWSYAQYYAYYYSYNPNQAYPLEITDISYSNTFSNRVEQTAIFGELSYDLTDKLQAFGGIRWAEFERDKFEQFDFPGGLLPIGDRAFGNGSFRDVGSDSDTIFKAGLRYNFDDERMIYGLFSQGFRLGGSNSPRAVATGRLPRDYKGDFLDNYEIGLKSQWLDGRMTLNISAFYMEWKDYLQGASFPDGEWWLRGTINAGGAETTGAEAQIRWQATDRLSFGANLFYADAEFKDNFCNNYENGVNLGCPTLPDGSVDPDFLQIRAGMRMPNAPEKTAWANALYEIPDVFGGDLWLYYDVAYGSETWAGTSEILDDDPNGRSPSWRYHNFSAGLALPSGWDVEVAVNNVTDENGYNFVFTGESGNANTFGDPRYQRQRAQDRPRTVWLTLRKRFGGQ